MIVVFLMALASGGTVRADQARDDLAQAAYERGVAALDAGQLDAALSAFNESYTQVPRAKTLLNIGVTYRRLGRTLDAANAYAAFLDDPGAPDSQKETVRQRLRELDLRLGKILLEIETSDRVQLDDLPLGLGPMRRTIRVEPGAHRVTVGARRFSVEAAAGTQERVTVVTAPPPPPAVPEPTRTITTRSRGTPWWLATGLLAAVDVGGAIYLARRGQATAADAVRLSREPYTHSYSEVAAMERAADRDVQWARIGVGVGAVLVAATGYLAWRWHRGVEVTTHVEPTGASVGARISF